MSAILETKCNCVQRTPPQTSNIFASKGETCVGSLLEFLQSLCSPSVSQYKLAKKEEVFVWHEYILMVSLCVSIQLKLLCDTKKPNTDHFF